MRFLPVLLSLCIFSFTHAQIDLISTRSARSGLVQSSGLLQKTLGFACLSVISLSDGLSCNPALNHFVKAPVLQFNGLLASGYPNLDDILSLTKGNLESDSLSRLLDGKKNQLETEAQISLIFKSSEISARYVPLSLYGVFVARNLANPEIQTEASRAQIFEIQSSKEFNNGLSIGARVEALKIDGLSYRANLLDFNIPKPSNQWRFNIVPGMSYLLPWALKTRVSALLSNFGLKKGSLPWTPAKPQLDVGLSVSPELKLGQLQFALDYRGVYESTQTKERLHLGAIYQLGSMSVASGFDYDGFSLGVYSALENLGAGVMFATNRVFWRDEIAYTQTMYVQLVWSF